MTTNTAQSPPPSRLRHAAIPLALTAAASLTACVTDGPAQTPRTERVEISTPAGLRPALVQINASPTAADTDNNGFADTIMLTAFVFPNPAVHPLPIVTEGTFLFTLTADDQQELATWEIPTAEAATALRQYATGPGYQLELNINEVATDRLPISRANLAAAFRTPDGTRLPERGSVTIQIGPTRLISR